MIEIKTLEIAGFISAFEALRLPFGKECRSETYFNLKTEPAQFIPECFINNPAELKAEIDGMFSTAISEFNKYVKKFGGSSIENMSTLQNHLMDHDLDESGNWKYSGPLNDMLK